MIGIQLTGTLPQVNSDFTEMMSDIGQLMLESVQQNFIAGGRPNQWEPLKTGEQAHLYKTGYMYWSVQTYSGSNEAVVFIDTNRVPQAAIHNFGGTIKHPGSSKFQAFFYNGNWIYTWGTKPHDIDIPARPFMMFQEEDKNRILSMFSENIFGTFYQSQGRTA